ncbi:MAG: hypothetical protein F6K03_03295 [Kamptonema sp. SIO4C4]|nr:hypothetical protein [Kamptonema sp. SIO4C4]
MSSLLKRLIQSLQVLTQEILRLPIRLSRMLARWFTLRRESQAGFVLPTVVMVILVVTLITSAIVIRSTDRAQNASNMRVSQVVLNSALPAVERAKLKLDAAFEDPTLPQGTPSDLSLNKVLEKSKYQLGDEVRLQLAIDFRKNNGSIGEDGKIQPEEALGLDKSEVSRTAWRYPVDTDGNGKFDSFTLYGIYFRTPGRDETGVAYERERLPLDARTPPQASATNQGVCAEALGTSASLVGAEGWNKIEGVLKKSFYIYTATVPITDPKEGNLLQNNNNFEAYQGNTAFAGLEYQQDRVRIPLGNNAIVYEDDLDMFSGPPFRVNGRVVVNSNLHAGESSGLYFYQVSSDESCFYEAENAKMIVGGNITNDRVGSTDGGTDEVDVDLFRGRKQDPAEAEINSSTKSTSSSNSSEVAYNTQAFEERISLLVEEAMGQNPNNDPEDIQDRINDRMNADVNPETDFDKVRREELEVWFRNRTRRVPFQEVGFGEDGTGGKTNVLEGKGTDLLRPIDEWHYPKKANDLLKIREQNPPATDPEDLKQEDPPTIEKLLGDRLLAGNNLPAFWLDESIDEFVGELGEQELSVEWTDAGFPIAVVPIGSFRPLNG